LPSFALVTRSRQGPGAPFLSVHIMRFLHAVRLGLEPTTATDRSIESVSAYGKVFLKVFFSGSCQPSVSCHARSLSEKKNINGI
jgi:hypothetical protein